MNDLKLNAWALIACMGMFAFTSCSNDDPISGEEGNENEIIVESGATLNGSITSGKTVLLKEGRSFQISGEYIVEDGGILKIEPGVTITAIRDETPDFILVKQGGYIDAQGTADSPIVMTAQIGSAALKDAGWGGIHICGYAHTNKGTGTKSEIGNAPYGNGTSTEKDNDNSGILKYIRLEYTGFALDEDHEANGLSLYGVGNGTTIEHIAIYKGGDDGIEFFGGSVNLKYAVVIDCEDDSYDWTEGWNGKAQFLVASQLGTTGDKDMGDCLMECDNNGDNAVANPVSHPILANLTLIGNNSKEGKRGIRLRAGTQVEIYNALISGKPDCISVETNETENALKEGTSILKYIASTGGFSSKQGIYTEDLYTAADNHNELTTEFSFTNTFVGTVAGGFDASSKDAFFTATDYKGAVKSGDAWINGSWIRK